MIIYKLIIRQSQKEMEYHQINIIIMNQVPMKWLIEYPKILLVRILDKHVNKHKI